MKTTAFAKFTYKPDGAAHQFGQLAANSQTQAGPPEFAGGGAVCLSKGSKDFVLNVWRDTDSAIADTQADQNIPFFC